MRFIRLHCSILDSLGNSMSHIDFGRRIQNSRKTRTLLTPLTSYDTLNRELRNILLQKFSLLSCLVNPGKEVLQYEHIQ